MRHTFVRTLLDLAKDDASVWLVCGDLGYSVLDEFAARFPERYLNVGVAEQNMTGVAAGLALSGKIVFTYSIANFPVARCLEQVRNDLCYHQLNVTIVAVGGGFAYGPAGYTHHAVEDLALMRAMPGMMVLAPGDPAEVGPATRAAFACAGPSYLRLGKGGEPTVHTHVPDIRPGDAIVLREGMDVTLISTGAILGEVVGAADRLAARGIRAGVISMPCLQPMGAAAVWHAAARSRLVMTVEEHGRAGGLGEAVAAVLSMAGVRPVALEICALTSTVVNVAGTQAYLRRMHGLDADGLAARAVAALQDHARER